MPLIRKRRAAEETVFDEESEVTPRPGRQRQPAAASRQRRRQPVDDDGDGDGYGDNLDRVGLDEDVAAEDLAAQGPGGSTADQLVKKMVRLALACEFSRQPLRRADISTKVLGPDSRRFRQVFEEAQKQLRDKFGVEMTELPIREKVTISQRRAAQRTEKVATTSKAYILTSILPPKYRSILTPPQTPTAHLESSYIGLYTFLISVISLSGGSIAEAKLERYLRRANADQHTPVDKTEKLLHRLCKEGYLMRVKESGGGEEVVEYMVGPRGKVEVGSEGVLGLVKGVYGDSAMEDLDVRVKRSMGLNEKPKTDRDRGAPQPRGGGDARNVGGQRRNIAAREELEGSSDED